MYVVDAKFDEYAIIYTIKTKGGVSDVLNKLHSKSCLCLNTQQRLTWTFDAKIDCFMITGRTPTISEALVEKFKKFCLDTGIQEENILILPPNGAFKSIKTLLIHVFSLLAEMMTKFVLLTILLQENAQMSKHLIITQENNINWSKQNGCCSFWVYLWPYKKESALLLCLKCSCVVLT